jgi:hypothetical protein
MVPRRRWASASEVCGCWKACSGYGAHSAVTPSVLSRPCVAASTLTILAAKRVLPTTAITHTPMAVNNSIGFPWSTLKLRRLAHEIPILRATPDRGRAAGGERGRTDSGPFPLQFAGKWPRASRSGFGRKVRGTACLPRRSNFCAPEQGRELRHSAAALFSRPSRCPLFGLRTRSSRRVKWRNERGKVSGQ